MDRKSKAEHIRKLPQHINQETLISDNKSIRDKINILGPPISAAEVVGRNEGPVGDRGDLQVDPPQVGHLHHGYREHQDEEHQASHLARI